MKFLHSALSLAVGLGMIMATTSVRADLDGHGPDAWRVTGVATNDVLNARMGPGTNYPVIDTFAHDERGMQQITCVPYMTPGHYASMSAAQIDALPPRWCLMRDAAMSKAGWVAQRFITPDDAVAPDALPVRSWSSTDAAESDPVMAAQDLVRELYEREFLSEGSGRMVSGLDPSVAHDYFTDDVVAWLMSGDVGAHPLYGTQDFDGSVGEPMPDPDQPMLRGMITINVDFVNFGQPQRAVFYLRADTTRPDAPLRIFRVEHEGWSYP